MFIVLSFSSMMMYRMSIIFYSSIILVDIQYLNCWIFSIFLRNFSTVSILFGRCEVVYTLKFTHRPKSVSRQWEKTTWILITSPLSINLIHLSTTVFITSLPELPVNGLSNFYFIHLFTSLLTFSFMSVPTYEIPLNVHVNVCVHSFLTHSGPPK